MSTKGGCHILAAEDDENDLIILKRAFKEINPSLPVYAVTDGGEVISYLGGLAAYSDRALFPLPDLLILDLKLPRKTGFEVLSWLKEHKTFRALPTVILTSSALKHDVNRGYELGAAGYFVKSTDPERFLQQIQVIYSYWCIGAERPSLKPHGSVFAASPALTEHH